jgi:hypothetical protein
MSKSSELERFKNKKNKLAIDDTKKRLSIVSKDESSSSESESEDLKPARVKNNRMSKKTLPSSKRDAVSDRKSQKVKRSQLKKSSKTYESDVSEESSSESETVSSSQEDDGTENESTICEESEEDNENDEDQMTDFQRKKFTKEDEIYIDENENTNEDNEDKDIDEEMFADEDVKEKVKYYAGTINTVPSKPLLGTKREKSIIMKVLSESHKEFKWGILQREACGGNGKKAYQFHYHFLVTLEKHTRYEATIKAMTEKLQKLFNITHPKEKKYSILIKPSLSMDKWMGYLYKEYGHTPVRFGKDYPEDEEIEKAKMKYAKKRNRKIQQINNKINKEEWIDELADWMKTKRYYVDFWTRRLMNENTMTELDIKEFGYELSQERKIVESNSIATLDKIEKLITSPLSYRLPVKKVNLEIIYFKDGEYNMISGLFRKLKPEEMTALPVFKSKKTFKEECKIPRLWLEKIRDEKWNYEEFMISYKRHYKKKMMNTPSLFLQGVPGAGKSSMLIPLLELFNSSYVQLTGTNKFAWQQMRGVHIALIEEIPVPSVDDQLSKMKQVFNGEKMSAEVKNGNIAQKIDATHILCTSNDMYREKLHQKFEYDTADAMVRRLDVYEFKNKFKYELDTLEAFEQEMKSYAVPVCILSTQQKDYINVEECKSIANPEEAARRKEFKYVPEFETIIRYTRD